ncbi:GIY-YIG nuclease family protein [Alteromonas sp. ASW11-19]|uniref:GIY-YIG nuclease family protein n=1 Tax=Alteromonas salexigens TaxID=2982530 RepID=A0ABT2VRS9_9ALTE|nr:GIY-YIG nuclease family protein [Alteromonas salexigens]MCU7555608.1 GIY-YIG nuclease family protein [Alteromonas salexigens]
MSASITANAENEESAPSSWYIYIIENRLGQFYTGITCDPKRRIAQHRGEKPGGAKALKGKSPLIYRAVFEVTDKRAAMKLEYQVKRFSRRQKEQLVNGKGPLPEDIRCESARFTHL